MTVCKSHSSPLSLTFSAFHGQFLNRSHGALCMCTALDIEDTVAPIIFGEKEVCLYKDIEIGAFILFRFSSE